MIGFLDTTAIYEQDGPVGEIALQDTFAFEPMTSAYRSQDRSKVE